MSKNSQKYFTNKSVEFLLEISWYNIEKTQKESRPLVNAPKTFIILMLLKLYSHDNPKKLKRDRITCLNNVIKDPKIRHCIELIFPWPLLRDDEKM